MGTPQWTYIDTCYIGLNVCSPITHSQGPFKSNNSKNFTSIADLLADKASTNLSLERLRYDIHTPVING